MSERRHFVKEGEQYSRLTVLSFVKRPVLVTFCECVTEKIYLKTSELVGV